MPRASPLPLPTPAICSGARGARWLLEDRSTSTRTNAIYSLEIIAQHRQQAAAAAQQQRLAGQKRGYGGVDPGGVPQGQMHQMQQGMVPGGGGGAAVHPLGPYGQAAGEEPKQKRSRQDEMALLAKVCARLCAFTAGVYNGVPACVTVCLGVVQLRASGQLG